MIFVVELECPHEHSAGGALHEHPSAEPPPTWCAQISIELAKWVKEHPAEFAKCAICGEPMGKAWRYVVWATTLKTMEEAVKYFDGFGRRIGAYWKKETIQ